MTGSFAIVQECCTLFRIKSFPNLIYSRKLNFVNKFREIDDNTHTHTTHTLLENHTTDVHD